MCDYFVFLYLETSTIKVFRCSSRRKVIHLFDPIDETNSYLHGDMTYLRPEC